MRVVGNVFVGVSAGREETIELLRDQPGPRGIIRRTQNQSATRRKHSTQLVEEAGLLGNMFDHLRAEDAREGLVCKGEPGPGRLYQRSAELSRVAQLAKQDVDGDATGWKRADDPARPAADVK